MPRFYIRERQDRNVYYQFNAPAAAYPEGVRGLLGVFPSLPEGGRATTRGNFKDYMITKVRIKLANGQSKVRLCDVDALGIAMYELPTVNAFGSTITEVLQLRSWQYRR